MGENRCIELGQMILQLTKAADKAVAIMQRPEVRHIALDYIETLEVAAGLAAPVLGQLATDAEAKALEARKYILDKDDWVNARRTLLAAGTQLEEAIFATVIECACNR
ncbi:hypothetical protein ES703_108372 [subsurface metagenome]